MNNTKRRELFTTALKPENNLNPVPKENEKFSLLADIIKNEQKPYREEDLPEAEEFVDLDNL